MHYMNIFLILYIIKLVNIICEYTSFDMIFFTLGISVMWFIDEYSRAMGRWAFKLFHILQLPIVKI